MNGYGNIQPCILMISMQSDMIFVFKKTVANNEFQFKLISQTLASIHVLR